MGVERGVATRSAQIVWPMMTVTARNFEGFTIGSNFEKFAKMTKMSKNAQIPHFCKFFKIAA